MRTVVLFVFLLCAWQMEAQKHGQARIDSLKTELPAASDAEKLDLYVQIMTTYNSFNRKEGFAYEKPALELALKLKSEPALADVKNVMGRLYWREQKFDVALDYHNHAKQIYERVNDKSKFALTIRYIGQDYADSGNYPEALKQFFIALSMYEELNDIRNRAYVLELLAWVYEKQGNYVAASQYSYAMLKLFEEMGDLNSVALSASTIAEYYIHLGNYDEALRYFKKSKQLYHAYGDVLNKAYSFMLIGKVHRITKKYDEAISNYDSALFIGKQVNDLNIIATGYNGMADVYQSKKDYEKALSYYQFSADIFKGSNKIDIAHVYCMMGDCYRSIKQYSQARKIYEQALEISKELNNKAPLAEYFQGMEKLDSTLGNWQTAYLHHKKYLIHRDSVFNQDNIKKMLQLQLQHEFDKKEEAIKQEQLEKDIRQKRQFIFISIISLLVFVLAIVLYRDQKRITKINQQLKLKSENLEEENREKESILKIVSHDLRAPFGKIKGLADLLQHEHDLTEAEKKQYFEYIQTSIDQGTYLIGHLLELQAVNHPAIPSFQVIDVAKFVYDFEQIVQGQLVKKQQQLQLSVESGKLELLTDKQMLTRILDNIVSNASKFSNHRKTIYLRVWSDNHMIHFSVRDEGPGISDDDQKKLFRKFQKLSAQPTAGEHSTGLGLSITKALVDHLNGTIQLKSVLGKGTEVIISLRYSPAAI